MLFGILRSKHVHLSHIARALEEDISIKKTTERLSAHLGREGLDLDLIHSHLEVNKRVFGQAKYLIGDMSDISKPYAEKMEGLDCVYDGSSGELGNGYWQFNIIGVDKGGTTIMPMLSRLYATEKEGGKGFSENKMILESVSMISEHVKKDQILVYDRGGDRCKLMYRWIKEKQYFIVRQTGERNIYVKDQIKNLESYAKKIRRTQQITIRKRRGNRIKTRVFECGAGQVYLPKEYGDGRLNVGLWLVSVKEAGKGWCWFLCYFPVKTKIEAVEMAMEGYGYRWKIEEVHRQVKTDYDLESVCLRRYTALKNFNVLFWMAIGFLYQHLENLSIFILQYSKEQLVYRRNKLSEYIGFVYYKLAKALSSLFSEIKLRKLRLKDKYKGVGQFALPFG